MSSNSTLKAAISEDESLVAVIVPSSDRGVIQIYQTETGLLQTTLTTRQANSLQANASTLTPATLQSVLFCGNNHVVARTSSSILIWDLTRGGVVAHTLSEKDRTFLDATCYDNHLYLLVGIAKSRRSSTGSDDDDEDVPLKLQVLQYDPTSGKQLRRVKCGKSDGSDEYGLAIQPAGDKLHLLVRTNGIKVFDASNGSKIAKYKHADKGKRNKKDGTGGSGILVCNHLVAIPRLSGVALFNTKTNKWLKNSVTGSSSQRSVHLWQGQDDDSVMMLVDQTLYACSETGTEMVRKLKSKHAMALLPQSGNKLTAVLHNPTNAKASLQIQPVGWKLNENDMDTDDELVLQWLTEDATAADEDTISRAASKRTAESLTVLGPGQAGGENTTVSERRKKLKVEEQEDAPEENEEGMSIADRLKKLSQVLDEDEDDDSDKEDTPEFAAHKATTESLSQLLGQALKGGDDNLLELALQVRNKAVIEETVAGLENGCVDTLLTKLTMRLASKPNRAEQLSHWVSIVLLSGKIRQKHQLQPLKNLLQERIEALPLLLRLEGRLAVVKANAGAKAQTSKRIVASKE